MKKLTAIAFMLLLLISQVSYWAIFSYKQYLAKQKARQEMMQTLTDDAFELIVAEDNAGKIQWEEDGKEFFLNGNMYDVAKTKMVNGKTHLYCLNDKIELTILVQKNNSLKKQYENTTAEKKQGIKSAKIPISDFNNHTFISTAYNIVVLPKNEQQLSCCILPNNHLKVLVPPPKA